MILERSLPDYKGLLMMELRSRYFKNIPDSRDNLALMLFEVLNRDGTDTRHKPGQASLAS